jgi:hypothetical protein
MSLNTGRQGWDVQYFPGLKGLKRLHARGRNGSQSDEPHLEPSAACLKRLIE